VRVGARVGVRGRLGLGSQAEASASLGTGYSRT
jgi:hypothetical protein